MLVKLRLLYKINAFTWSKKTFRVFCLLGSSVASTLPHTFLSENLPLPDRWWKPLSLLWLLVSRCSFLLKIVSYFRVGSLFFSWLQYLRMCSQNACQTENLIINSSAEGCWIRDEDDFRKISNKNNTMHIFWVPHTFPFAKYF